MQNTPRNASANRARVIAQFLVLFLAYFATAKQGLKLGAVSGFASLVWPPTGIALAALVFGGYRLWPAVTLAAFLVNLLNGAPWFSALGIGVGNTLEALLGTYLLCRAKFRPSLDRTKEVLKLVFLAALLSTLVSAVIGIVSLWLGNVIQPSNFGGVFLAWWLGDVMGDLIVAPLLLIWGATLLSKKVRHPKRYGEALALGICTLLVLGCMFPGLPLPTLIRLHHAYFLIPLLFWAALRFEQLGAITLTFMISVLSVWGTAVGSGPFFEAGPLSESFISLQTYIAVVTPSTLVLAAAITERRKSAEALRKSQVELERTVKDRTEALELARARDEIVAVVSHDLKNPLSGIISAAKTVQRISSLDENGQRLLRVIQQSADQMNRLIQELLDVHKIEARCFDVQEGRREHRPYDLVKQALETQLIHAAEKKICVEMDVPEDIPLVSVNAPRIHQVFQNLIDNAIKFTPEGGLILVKAKSVNSHVVFSVKDNGPGIPESLLPHIFDRFRQAKETSMLGAGLGLTIAKGIVEAHSGAIWVESRVGEGCTFFFTVPKAIA